MKDGKHFDSQSGRFIFADTKAHRMKIIKQNHDDMQLYRDLTEATGLWYISANTDKQLPYLRATMNLTRLAILLNMTPERCLEYLIEDDDQSIPATPHTTFDVIVFIHSTKLLTVKIRANIVVHIENKKVMPYTQILQMGITQNKTWSTLIQSISNKFFQ